MNDAGSRNPCRSPLQIYRALAGEQINLSFADSQHREDLMRVFAQTGSTPLEGG